MCVVVVTLSTSHNPPTFGSDIHTGDSLVMPLELIFECETGIFALVQLDGSVTRDCEEGAVGGEGVVADGLVEEEVDFRVGHCDWLSSIGDSQLPIECASYC